jgi:hypothetical protein
MAIDHYHLRCGGRLLYIGLDEGEDFYRCVVCQERGYPFVESMVDDEDRERNSDVFDVLPTTLNIDGKTIVVCALMPNAEDGNRFIIDLLNAARERDAERERGSKA